MAKKSGMKFGGVALVQKRLKDSGERARNAAGAACYGLGNDVLNVSKDKIPVDFGVAKNSGYVTLPQQSAFGVIRVEFGHGGAAKDYIIPLHENLTARHPTGEAKFLEHAIHEARSGAQAKLVQYFSEAFERNAKAVKLGKTTPDGG
jgi:hypothetical protein